MRLLPVLALIPFFGSLICAERIVPDSDVFFVDSADANLEPMSPTFSRLYDLVMQQYDPHTQLFDFELDEYDLVKRDALEDTLVELIQALNRSGVVLDVLHEIASSPEQMNTLSNYIFQLLLKVSTSNAFSGLNVLINITELRDTVLDSGLIQLTLQDLLLDENERNLFADNLGEVFVNYSWIGKTLKIVGDHGKLSFDLIFKTIQDYHSKDPGFNGTSYPKLRKRDNSSDYDGSLQAFLNNLVGTALESQLASASLSSILGAVNRSGVAVPVIQTAVGDQKILQMVGFIGNKLYNFGVFDNIPLNDYFQTMKKTQFISNLLEALLTNPTWSPPLAMILERMENEGVFEQIRRNLYGP